MMTEPDASFAEYAAELRAFIARETSDDVEFNRLALQLFALQYERVPIYRELCQSRSVTPSSMERWEQIPALPTEVFKEFEVTSLTPAERTSMFYSSGTTAQQRSRHFHSEASLALYEDSLRPWFERHFLGDGVTLDLLALTPERAAAPNSSLVHMFDIVARSFPWKSVTWAGRLASDGGWELDMELAVKKLRDAKGPIAILGTAYLFVHLLDAVGRIPLPKDSRVLETGGYKGRSREMPKAALLRLISRGFNLSPARIVSEYGMSELSSQAYEHDGVFHFPPWARARVVSPETGREAAEAEAGLLQVFDLANARSVLAVQTADVVAKRGHGFAWQGRAENAEPRGCSLMAV